MKRKDKVLPPVRANAGVEMAYRRKIERLLAEMHRSISYWVKAAYRKNEPVIAQDEAPAEALKKVIAELSRRWMDRFDEGAEELAAYFATAASERSDATLRAILKKAGFSIEFELSPAQQDVLAASIQQNVALIKSIPQQYLTQVEGSVMRAVQMGHDIGSLAKELEAHYGVSRRRAAFIARDQSAKVTAAMNRVRQTEIGVTEAVWVHSGGGRHPRPTHLKAGKDKQRYPITDGWLDPAIGKRIWPGTEPNCRCVSRSIIEGFI